MAQGPTAGRQGVSVDIERKVTYDQTVEAIEDILPKTRTVITMGDDGFASVEETTYDDKGHYRTKRIGLTPAMLAALRVDPFERLPYGTRVLKTTGDNHTSVSRQSLARLLLDYGALIREVEAQNIKTITKRVSTDERGNNDLFEEKNDD